MGLFKSIKKAVKSVIKGIGKVFKAILKPFAKLLNNKWIRGALLAVSLFTGGAALLGAFKAGGLKAAGNFILQKAVEVVTLPIDIAAKGLGALGSITGSEGLKNFATSISDGLDTLATKAGNVFQTDTNSIASQFSEASGISGTPDNPVVTMNTDTPIGTTVDSGGVASQVADVASQPFSAGAPAPVDAGGFGTGSGGAPWRVGVDPSAVSASSGVTGAGGATGKSGVMDWVTRNAEGLKFVTDAVAGFTGTNDYEDQQKAMEDMYGFIDSQFAPYATAGYGGNPVPPGRFDRLRQRNALLHSRAAQSRARLGQGGS